MLSRKRYFVVMGADVLFLVTALHGRMAPSSCLAVVVEPAESLLHFYRTALICIHLIVSIRRKSDVWRYHMREHGPKITHSSLYGS